MLEAETSDARRLAGRQGPKVGLLEENLESKIDRAAALDKMHREVQVDFVGSRENGGRLEVVADARERLGTPLLDEVDLEIGSLLKLCRRHCRLSHYAFRSPCIRL
jgi:hypothetical protein